MYIGRRLCFVSEEAAKGLRISLVGAGMWKGDRSQSLSITNEWGFNESDSQVRVRLLWKGGGATLVMLAPLVNLVVLGEI